MLKEDEINIYNKLTVRQIRIELGRLFNINVNLGYNLPII